MTIARTINTENGRTIIVDRDDYYAMKRYRWHVTSNGYVVRWINTRGGKRMFFLHRQIMPCNPGSAVKHRNGDKLDNRKQNLVIERNKKE